MTEKDYNLLIVTYFECLVDIFGVDKAILYIYELNKKRGSKL